jgi:acetyl-CoA C-acetyltransferase
MSQSVHALHMRNGTKFGNAEFKDTMISDGLTDAFSNIHMGITGLND